MEQAQPILETRFAEKMEAQFSHIGKMQPDTYNVFVQQVADAEELFWKQGIVM
jgi:hypothetical protein